MIVHCNGIFIPRKHSGALLMCAWLPQLITYVHIFGRKCIKDIGYVQYFVLKCVLSLLQIMKLPMNYSVPPSTKGRHPAPFSIKSSMNLSKPLSLVLPTQWEKHWMKSGELLRIENFSALCFWSEESLRMNSVHGSWWYLWLKVRQIGTKSLVQMENLWNVIEKIQLR